MALLRELGKVEDRIANTPLALKLIDGKYNVTSIDAKLSMGVGKHTGYWKTYPKSAQPSMFDASFVSSVSYLLIPKPAHSRK